jgi:hypothetical protein
MTAELQATSIIYRFIIRRIGRKTSVTAAILTALAELVKLNLRGGDIPADFK